MVVLLDSAVSGELVSWIPFFALTGAAAATLIGLLFVAVSINVRVLDLESSAPVRGLAIRTLGSFVYILLLSLIFLIPHISALSLGISMGITAGVFFIRIVAAAIGSRRMSRSAAIALLGYLLSLAVAQGLAQDRTGWLNLIPVILVTSLGVGATNSWELLLQIGRTDPNSS